MLISQILDEAETIRVIARNGGKTRIINGARSVYSLAMEAARTGTGLVALIERKGFGEAVDLDAAYKKGRLLSPINHPDPAHLHLTGTGLTHLGSAATRDAMHKKLDADREEQLTDSMKMFRMGLEGGKPSKGQTGVQPEWFYKGNGTMAVAPGAALLSPAFAQDAGEEPEVAGIYVIGDDGVPFRVGFTLSNEFSDHITERVNYLFLAHSKLRNASFGPEILIGDLPSDVRGTLAHPPRRQAAVGKAVPVGRGEHVAHHRQSRTSSLQIFGPSASRATFMCTCSARRHCPSPTASGPKPATCSRSRPRILACRCATRLKSSNR